MQGHRRTREGLRPRHKPAAAHAGGDCHAIAAIFTALRAVLGKRADARSAMPVAVTRRAVAAASIMRRDHAATGCAKIT